jgi:hypothetical protein
VLVFEEGDAGEAGLAEDGELAGEVAGAGAEGAIAAFFGGLVHVLEVEL